METKKKVLVAADFEKREIEIFIDYDYLYKLGEGSIIGIITQEFTRKDPTLGQPYRVIFTFPRTADGWKSKNNGPKDYIVTEHTIPCLIQDILWLKKQGVEVFLNYSIEE